MAGPDKTAALVVALSAQLTKFERDLKRGGDIADREVSNIEKRFLKLNKNIEKSFDFSGVAARGLAALGAGFSSAAALKAVSAASQQFTDLQNALKVTGLEGAALEKTFGSLFQIAQKNGTAIAPLTTLYSRAAQSQKELNASSADLLKFTDGVSTALRVAGTNSTQAAGALLQLSQAIGGGVVRAEEFNSVNEGARPILQAVAAGLKEAGGSVSTLKTLVNDGKVSSEAFFRAFLAGMPLIESQAAKASGTISQANERISNAFVLLVGNLDKTTGASSNAAKNLNALGGVLEKMPGYFDAASKKLETFQSYLTQIGNSPVWSKIANLMGAALPAQGSGGLEDISVIQDRLRLDTLNKTISQEETRLQDIISNTVFKADQRTIKVIEDGIAQMRADRDRLAAALSAAAPQSAAGPGGRIAEGARDPSGRAPAPPTIKPVSLKDFKVPGEEKEKGGSDPFERTVAQIERRTAVLNAETAAIDLGAAAQARARIQTELETAAKRANEAAGLKNAEVTEAQRAKITALADAYIKAAQAAESANSPLLQFARAAQDSQRMSQEFALGGLRSLEDGLVDIVTGTENAAEAFNKMANAIIADLARIAIRQAITGPIAAALGGGGGGGSLAGLFGGARASGGPVEAGKAYVVGEKRPELFVPNRSGMIMPRVAVGGGQTFAPAYYINAAGADSGTVARIQTVLAQHARVIAGQSQAMASAQRMQATGVG